MLSLSMGINVWMFMRRLNHSPMKAGFVLRVQLNFRSQEAKETFLIHFESLLDTVKHSEPNTLSFQLMESEKSPLRLLLFERFTDKEIAYQQVHRSSTAFVKLKSYLHELGQMGVTVEGESYTESYGFIHSPEMTIKKPLPSLTSLGES